MLPDLSPAHILIVVVVALIVVGPKDLPMLLRKIGQFMAKMRGMANEFRASFDEMARQSELDDLRKEVEAMRAAATTATPDLGLESDLGLNAALNSDAEGAFVHEWQASQFAPDDPSIMPPAAAKPVKVAKSKSPSKATSPKAPSSKGPSSKGKPAKTDGASAKTSAKTKAAAPAKSGAKKAKPAGTAS
jgi:sec-independent protein translocase protein TatB